MCMRSSVLVKAAVALSFLVIASHQTSEKKRKYIVYDIDSYEGFNVRLRAYQRVAAFVKGLNKISSDQHFTLILPPWGPFHHWRNDHIGDQVNLPWRSFFDTDSLNRYVPVMELDHFLEEEGELMIDKAIVVVSTERRIKQRYNIEPAKDVLVLQENKFYLLIILRPVFFLNIETCISCSTLIHR